MYRNSAKIPTSAVTFVLSCSHNFSSFHLEIFYNNQDSMVLAKEQASRSMYTIESRNRPTER